MQLFVFLKSGQMIKEKKNVAPLQSKHYYN